MAASNQWLERELPTAQLVDSGYKNVILLPSSSQTGRTLDFTAWVNDVRAELYPELLAASELAQTDFHNWDVDPTQLASLMGDILQVEPLNQERIVFHEDMAAYTTYHYAVNAKFLPATMTDTNAVDAHGQFVSLLHFIRLNRTELSFASRAWRTETLLHELGHAGIGGLVDVVVPDGAQSMPYNWNGYTYRHNDMYRGYVLDEAAAIKAAALVRNRLMPEPALPGEHPMLSPYRLPEGYVPGIEQALILDLISARSQTSAHSLVWEFAKLGRPGAIRNELQQVVANATDGTVTLDDIEALSKNDQAAHVTMLRRIEDAAGIETSRRVSKALGYN